MIICSGGERTGAWYTLTKEETWTPETSVHFHHSTRTDTLKYRFFQEFNRLNDHGDEGSTKLNEPRNDATILGARMVTSTSLPRTHKH